jgi:hypothetical protein
MWFKRLDPALKLALVVMVFAILFAYFLFGLGRYS